MMRTILILHGWSMAGNRYYALKEILTKSGYKVFTPDLPGLDGSASSKTNLTLDDYASYLKKYIEKNDLKNFIIICHSFGGRVFANFFELYPKLVKKTGLLGIILSGTPLVRQPLTLRKKIAKHVASIGKNVFSFSGLPETIQDFFRKVLYKSIGEYDYYNARKRNLDKTFKNIIHVSNEQILKKISIPTLLLWGERDTITPLSTATFLQRIIPNSRLITIQHATHRAPIENASEFAKYTLQFIKKL